MKKELQQQLYDKYPDLYEQHTWHMSKTCMCWGFEVPDEWFDLIDELSEQLVAISPETRAVQVKIKFDKLRFIVEQTDPANKQAVFSLIGKAQAAALKV